MSESPVIIVGAGLSGLSCALHLHAKGIPVHVFEKSDRVGGRVVTEVHDGFRLDRGFQVLLTAYPEAREVLDYGQLELCRFEPGALIRFQGKFRRFVDPWRRPSALIETALSPIGTIGDKLKVAKLRHLVSKGSLEELMQRPELRTIDALKQRGFSQGMIERFFRPFLGGIFLEGALETSSRKFEYVFRMFSQGDAALPKEGMVAIPNQLMSRLPDGTVRTGCGVSSVESNAIVLDDGTRVEGRSVVVACDKDSGDRLLRADKPSATHHVDCFYFAADKPPIEQPILVLNGDGEGPINNLCVPSQVSASYAPAGKSLISVTCLDGVDDGGEGLETAVLGQLKSWFGGQVDSWKYLKRFHIQHALPAQPPPELSPVAKPVRRDDGVYVCGDHMDIASIQGAMLSGRRVAEAILRSER